MMPLFLQQPGVPGQTTPAQGIRTAQTICVAMILGVTAFLFVTLMIPAQPKFIVLAYLGAAGAAIIVVLRFVIPGIVVKHLTKNLAYGDIENIDAQLWAIFQTKMIVGLALLEGACFFNLIAYMTERQWWTLAVVGVLLFLMISMFPTLGQFESWAETVKHDRQNQF